MGLTRPVRTHVLVKGGALGILLLVGAASLGGSIDEFDRAAVLTANQLLNTQGVAPVAFALTQAGTEWVWPAFAALVSVRRATKRRAALALAAAMVVADVALLAVKSLSYRPRPDRLISDLVIPYGPETDSAFPSGHASRAFAAGTILHMYWPRIRVVGWGVAVVVGLTRIVLGYHYPSDVVAGATFGVLVAYALSKATPSLLSILRRSSRRRELGDAGSRNLSTGSTRSRGP